MARWTIFETRCKTDFGFDPVADGVLTAAERLAKASGKWSAVSELYQDSFASFPFEYEKLLKVQSAEAEAAQKSLFSRFEDLSGYPQVNEELEANLGWDLSNCSVMDGGQARLVILGAEKDHGFRRERLWRRMGHAPLAEALTFLAQVAELTKTLPSGQTPDELASSYLERGWQVDDAVLRALGAVTSTADVESISKALRSVYLPWLEALAKRFQHIVKAAGGLPKNPVSQPGTAVEAGTCTVFVDGLRYDVAIRLQQALGEIGVANISARWSSTSSVTASGKAMCSPVSAWYRGRKRTLTSNQESPRVESRYRPSISANC